MMPRKMKRMPNRKDIIPIVDAHPGTTDPKTSLAYKACASQRKDTKLVIMPIVMPIRRGTIEKEVMACHAKRSIRRKLYLLFPAYRLRHWYSIAVLRYPTHCTSPRRNNPSSRNWSSSFTTGRSRHSTPTDRHPLCWSSLQWHNVGYSGLVLCKIRCIYPLFF